MTTLYQLTDEMRAATANLDAMLADGDIDQEAYSDTMEAITGETKDKAINVGLHIKNLRSDADQYKNAISEMQAKAKRIASSIEFYENYLETNLRKSDIDQLKNEYIDIKFKKLPAIVDITGDVPDEYTRIVPEKREADKREIKKALDAGEELDFATLITGRESLSIT